MAHSHEGGPRPPTTTRRKFLQGLGSIAALGAAGLGFRAATLAAPPVPGQAPENSLQTAADLLPRVEAAESQFPKYTIDGLESYGVDGAGNSAPLTAEQTTQLITDLNANSDRISQNPAEWETFMSRNTIYGTATISKTMYDKFKPDNGESYQAFVKRHEAKCNQMMREAGLTDMNFKLRRLVVVADGVTCPSSQDLAYIQKGIKDSDGMFNIHQQLANFQNSTVNGGYKPSNDPYQWDAAEKIHYRFLHEAIGHDFFHLYDQNFFLIRNTGMPESIRSQIPDNWETFVALYRTDIFSDDIMANIAGRKFDVYSKNQLERRRAQNHNLIKIIPETRYAPPEFPLKVSFKFQDVAGNDLPITSCRIYRTKAVDTVEGVVLIETPIYEGDAKDINLSTQIFTTKTAEGYISPIEGTCVIIAEGGGRKYLRTGFTAADGNNAAWGKGENNPTQEVEKVTMEMKMLDITNSNGPATPAPADFPWGIGLSDVKLRPKSDNGMYRAFVSSVTHAATAPGR